ncbi:alpha/beta hydrolase [Aestuariibacter salexigens]|uniref:alpha/beta hydrolase n=1 Tax=Aestuariibacter salexigens TaxID=226010 RepID=UPI001F0B2C5F|nr:alpha/beta hydrolase [Aestuariibacter salexigens]
MTFLLFDMAYAHQPASVDVGRVERISSLESKHVPMRDVDVWLPEGYPAKGTRYNVLYMHDGQMLFDASTTWNKQSWQVANTAQRLQDEDKTPPFIVVGVHNGGANRHSEYFPQKPFECLSKDKQNDYLKLQRSPGQPLFTQTPYSDNYLRYLVEELKPFIDKLYATNPDVDSTFIAGSSMGGLISWYALVEYPDVFGGAAAISTHWPGIFDIQGNPLPEIFKDYLTAHLPQGGNHKLYFDYGDATLDALYPPLQQSVDDALRKLASPDIEWQTHYFKSAAHKEEDWAARLHVPLVFLLN